MWLIVMPTLETCYWSTPGLELVLICMCVGLNLIPPWSCIMIHKMNILHMPCLFVVLSCVEAMPIMIHCYWSNQDSKWLRAHILLVHYIMHHAMFGPLWQPCFVQCIHSKEICTHIDLKCYFCKAVNIKIFYDCTLYGIHYSHDCKFPYGTWQVQFTE